MVKELAEHEKLDVEVKAKWVAALRSGTYEQGKEWLRTLDNKFCCLGVVADICDSTLWSSKPASFHYEGLFAVLSKRFRDEIKLTVGDHSRLIGLNDNGKSFAEIADWIEANL